VAISLGHTLLYASSGVRRRVALSPVPGEGENAQAAPSSLAPDGVYPSSTSPLTRCALTLSPEGPHHFALTAKTINTMPSPIARGGEAKGQGEAKRRYVSVALSGGSPRPAVSRHRCPVEPGLSSVAFLAGRAAATRMTSALSIAYFAPRVTGRLAPAEWSCLWASSRPRAWRERRRSRSRSHRRSVSEAAGHGKRIGSQAAFPASKPSAG
jgi:hypothetical protein